MSGKNPAALTEAHQLAIDALTAKVKLAAEESESLRIVGGDSKAFYGRDLSELKTISTSDLDQVISYEPSELVMQVQAGCSLEVVKRVLDDENQMLGFEPTDFGHSTIGGAIASGLSGSRRPFAGAGRDFLLGVGLLDGAGQHLHFGGQVMKNVAGYDVSRLMAGAMGCLGLLTEASFKVLPKPETEQATSKSLPRDQLAAAFAKFRQLPEISALAYWQGRLYARFSGSESSVKDCLRRFDGESLNVSFFEDLDSLKLFSQANNVWRVSTEVSTIDDGFEQADLIDWGGGQRWFLDCDEPPLVTRGYTTLVKTDQAAADRFSPLPPYVMELHRKLKQTFDPYNVFNPGKMYADF